MRRLYQRNEKQKYKWHTPTSNKNNVSKSSSSDELEYEVFGEEDFDKEINIFLNKKLIN